MPTIDLIALRRRLADLPAELSSRLAGVLSYPHPLTGGGLLFVFRDGTGPLASSLPEVFSLVPEGYPVRCLRRSELWELALPGFFMPPLTVNDLPHASYWIRYRGEVLFGLDLRSEIPFPAAGSGVLLAGHIDGCRHYLRPYGIVRRLVHGEHRQLIGELREQALHLMATALLEAGVWDIDLATLPATFEARFPGDGVAASWRQIDALDRVAKAGDEPSAGAACQAAWHFESFLWRLEANMR